MGYWVGRLDISDNMGKTMGGKTVIQTMINSKMAADL